MCVCTFLVRRRPARRDPGAIAQCLRLREPCFFALSFADLFLSCVPGSRCIPWFFCLGMGMMPPYCRFYFPDSAFPQPLRGVGFIFLDPAYLGVLGIAAFLFFWSAPLSNPRVGRFFRLSLTPHFGDLIDCRLGRGACIFVRFWSGVVPPVGIFVRYCPARRDLVPPVGLNVCV